MLPFLILTSSASQLCLLHLEFLALIFVCDSFLFTPLKKNNTWLSTVKIILSKVEFCAFCKCIQLCSHHHHRYTVILLHTSNRSIVSGLNCFHSPGKDLSSISILSRMSYKCYIMHVAFEASFFTQHTALDFQSGVACISLYIFIAEQYSVIQIYHNLSFYHLEDFFFSFQLLCISHKHLLRCQWVNLRFSFTWVSVQCRYAKYV